MQCKRRIYQTQNLSHVTRTYFSVELESYHSVTDSHFFLATWRSLVPRQLTFFLEAWRFLVPRQPNLIYLSSLAKTYSSSNASLNRILVISSLVLSSVEISRNQTILHPDFRKRNGIVDMGRGGGWLGVKAGACRPRFYPLYRPTCKLFVQQEQHKALDCHKAKTSGLIFLPC